MTHTGTRFFAQKDGEVVKSLTLRDLLWGIRDTDTNPSNRNDVFRGINLGSVVTDEQWTEIKTGTFRNMFLGDYWQIGGMKWVIVDFDYFYQLKNDVIHHHVVLMPSDTLYQYVLNPTNTTSGGFVNSDLYKNGLQDANDMIVSAFGSNHLLNLPKMYSNATNADGYVTGTIRVNEKVIIPGEIEMYGMRNVSNSNSRLMFGGLFIEYGTLQFSLCRMYPRFLKNITHSYWLSDIASDGSGKIINPGSSIYTNANNTEPGVRPYFAIYAP